jgi:hypothetical protein
MGYNLIIGNAILKYDNADLRVWIEAEGAESPEAPDDDPFVGKANSRSPSYTAWHDFCREAGIHELFYGQGWDRGLRSYRQCSDHFHRKTPLLKKCPGVQPISHDDLEYVMASRIKREQSNGGKPPGFWEDDGADNGTDPTLARLLWLEFWMGWALTNCPMPIIQNS